MNVSQELNNFLHSFHEMATDEVVAWGCIGVGLIIILVGYLFF